MRIFQETYQATNKVGDHQSYHPDGGYKWKAPPHQKTSKKSNKIFSMATGHTAPGNNVVELPLPVRGKAFEGHTAKGIKNNLYSLNRLVKGGYVSFFECSGFKVCNSTNTRNLGHARCGVARVLLSRQGSVAHPVVE